MKQMIKSYPLAWGSCMFFYASVALAIPFLEDAEANLKQDPDQSLVLFQQALPELSTLPVNQQIGWYKVAIEANNSLFEIDKSYEHVQYLHENYWNNANKTDKRFMAKQLGGSASMKGDFDAALTIFNCAMQLVESETQKLSILNNIAIVYIQTGRWEEAKDMYLEGIKLAKKVSDQGLNAAMSNNLGHIYNQPGETTKAQEAFKIAYVIKTRLGQTKGRLSSLHNLMQSIVQLKDWEQWEQYAPLHKRMLEETKIPELSAMREWMLAYKNWAESSKSVDDSKRQYLKKQSEKIQNPTAMKSVNAFAKEMQIPLPFDLKEESAKSELHIDYLRAAGEQCTAELM